MSENENQNQIPDRWKHTIGNQYWRLRARSGRFPKIESAEKLAELADQYFDFIDENPFIAIDYKGKDAIECSMPKMRPYSIQGFCTFAGISHEAFANYRKHKDFTEIATRIVQIIETQQFEGATSGFLNPSIIARTLGLADKKEVEVENTVRYIIDDGEDPEDE